MATQFSCAGMGGLGIIFVATETEAVVISEEAFLAPLTVSKSMKSGPVIPARDTGQMTNDE